MLHIEPSPTEAENIFENIFTSNFSFPAIQMISLLEIAGRRYFLHNIKTLFVKP